LSLYFLLVTELYSLLLRIWNLVLPRRYRLESCEYLT